MKNEGGLQWLYCGYLLLALALAVPIQAGSAHRMPPAFHDLLAL
jgi:hypothetical protein